MAAPKKTQKSEDDQKADESAQATEPGAASANEPRPWRVETYAQGGKWGWRLCAANGTIVRDSSADFDNQEAAVAAAEGEDFADTAVIMDKQAQPVRPRGW